MMTDDEKKARRKEREKRYYQENIEERRAKSRAYAARKRKENRADYLAKKTAYYEANREKLLEKCREYYAQKLYQLGQGELAEMRIRQENRCAICGQKARLQIDHDHQTGAVRALLCSHCNRAIGLLHDDAALCRAAMEYLLKHAPKTQMPSV